MGVSLPVEYRQSLLDSNGGVPTPDTIDIPGLPGSCAEVQVFFGIGRSGETSCLEWNVETLAERLDPTMLPIARDSGGSVYCLSIRQRDYGAILYCDLQSVFGDMDVSPESILLLQASVCFWAISGTSLETVDCR
jgi:hypothetical protein